MYVINEATGVIDPSHIVDERKQQPRAQVYVLFLLPLAAKPEERKPYANKVSRTRVVWVVEMLLVQTKADVKRTRQGATTELC
jgi:hypothetical protein